MEKTHQMVMDLSILKISFPNFILQNRFEKCRLFFIQIILMSKVGKCPKHIGNEAIPLLRHSVERSYGAIAAVSHKYFKFFLKIEDSNIIAAMLHVTSL